MNTLAPVVRDTIGKYVVEACYCRDGKVLLRTPEIYPVNARDWHGPYPDMKTAREDFTARTATPKISRRRLAWLRQHGYAGDVGGREMITRLDPWTGATTLSDYELIEEAANA